MVSGLLTSAKNRLPTRHEALMIFGIAGFPIFFWANIQVFRELPAWLLRLSTSQLVGTLSYVEAFALIESLVFFFGVLLLTSILAGREGEERRLALAFAVTTALSATGVATHYFDQTLRQMGWLGVIPPIGVAAATAAPVIFLAWRSEKWARVILELVERIVLLSFLYVAVGLGGLFIIIVRNWV